MKIKICGITNLEDGLAAAQAGADFLGFIFHPQLAALCDGRAGAGDRGGRAAAVSRTRRPKCVGVFVNTPPAQVRYVLYTAGLNYAQLHGDEGPGELAEQRGRGYKAVRPRRWTEALAAAERYSGLGPQGGPTAARRLSSDGVWGHRARADWSVAAAWRSRVPRAAAGRRADARRTYLRPSPLCSPGAWTSAPASKRRRAAKTMPSCASLCGPRWRWSEP